MSSRTLSTPKSEDRPRFHIDDNVRGIVIVIAGSLALVGLAYGGMVLLTGPNGWATQAANAALGQPIAENE